MGAPVRVGQAVNRRCSQRALDWRGQRRRALSLALQFRILRQRRCTQGFHGFGFGLGPIRTGEGFWIRPVLRIPLVAAGFDDLPISPDGGFLVVVQPSGDGESAEKVGVGFLIGLQ